MTEAAATPKRRPAAERPWYAFLRCVSCRRPLGARDSLVLGFVGGGMIGAHDDCALPPTVEVWS